METSWASENLHVIRTLMERSALYRRALAPVMLVSGLIGFAGAGLGYASGSFSTPSFIILWMAIAMVALVTAFLLVRRQALKDAEPFWSPPMRRVTWALLPAFFAGLIAGIGGLLSTGTPVWIISAAWLVSYGCGLHAAGFFMERGIRLFSWMFVAGGCAVILGASSCSWLQNPSSSHCLMGLFFGGFQLAYGIYLYFSERRAAV
jgi:hypothetical protein